MLKKNISMVTKCSNLLEKAINKILIFINLSKYYKSSPCSLFLPRRNRMHHNEKRVDNLMGKNNLEVTEYIIFMTKHQQGSNLFHSNQIDHKIKDHKSFFEFKKDRFMQHAYFSKN